MWKVKINHEKVGFFPLHVQTHTSYVAASISTPSAPVEHLPVTRHLDEIGMYCNCDRRSVGLNRDCEYSGDKPLLVELISENNVTFENGT